MFVALNAQKRNKLMRKKILLYVGILLLVVGLILKFTVTSNFISYSFIIAGIALKLIYLIKSVVTKEVKLGGEMFLLIIGISFVLIGAHLKTTSNYFMLHPVLITVGVVCKIIFVAVWIKKAYKTNN